MTTPDTASTISATDLPIVPGGGKYPQLNGQQRDPGLCDCRVRYFMNGEKHGAQLQVGTSDPVQAWDEVRKIARSVASQVGLLVQYAVCEAGSDYWRTVSPSPRPRLTHAVASPQVEPEQGG